MPHLRAFLCPESSAAEDLPGDGCISGSRSPSGFYPYVSLSFNPTREPWIGQLYARLLAAHGIRFSEQSDRPTLHRIRSWGSAAVELARLVYDRPGWAHPLKAGRARALIEGRAGDWPLRIVPRRNY
jgi:hypothetical protein